MRLGRRATIGHDMSDESKFKLAFIGSHGVGKTTLCYGLAARLKALMTGNSWPDRKRTIPPPEVHT